jgi:hypothetical protein
MKRGTLLELALPVVLIACSPDVQPPRLTVDLETVGVYTTGATVRGKGSYAAFLFVADGQLAKRAPGGHVEDNGLRVRLDILDATGKSVLSRVHDTTRMVYGNWTPPDTAIILLDGGVVLERGVTYEVRLEVLAETHAYGRHPTALVFTAGGK